MEQKTKGFRAIVVGLVMSLLGVLALGASPAFAGTSDSATPYTVTVDGIYLPDGETFQDNGHVNVRTNQGDRGIHFESLNNQPSGKWIGQNFLPWGAFGFDPTSLCVTWVQLSQYNEHFGEGGQTPVGLGCTPSTPEPTPTMTSTPEPTRTPEPTPEPTKTPEPTPEPTKTPEPTPVPTTTPEPTPTVTVTPTSTPEPTSTPAVSPVNTPSNTPSNTPVAVTKSASTLANTGTDFKFGFLFGGAVLLFGGISLILLHLSSRKTSK